MRHGDIQLDGIKHIPIPVINQEHVAQRGIVPVFFDGTPGIERIDPLLGNRHVGKAHAVGTVVGHVGLGFFLDIDIGMVEADEANTLGGRTDNAAEVDEAAVHVGADEGGLVRADA